MYSMDGQNRAKQTATSVLDYFIKIITKVVVVYNIALEDYTV